MAAFFDPNAAIPVAIGAAIYLRLNILKSLINVSMGLTQFQCVPGYQLPLFL